MPKMIFVNLPVADVAASTAFYEAIGFEKNSQFSNEQSSSMVWSDAIYVMLLAKPFFSTFTEKTIVDATTSTTGHYALSFDSREEVDAITRAAVEAGGRELHEPQDMGFMYSRAFEDLDVMALGRSGWTLPRLRRDRRITLRQQPEWAISMVGGSHDADHHSC